MAITAAQREELRELARGALGERGAQLLMSGLEATDLAGVEQRLALRVDVSRSELRTEMAELRTELKGEMAELRTELKGEMAELRSDFGELRGEFGELRGEVRGLAGKVEALAARFDALAGELRAEIATQVRVFYFAIVTTLVGLAGLLYTAYQAGRG